MHHINVQGGQVCPVATNVAVRYMLPGTIADEAIPSFGEAKDHFQVRKYGKQAFVYRNLQRALRTKPVSIETTHDHDEFKLIEYALETERDWVEVNEAAEAGALLSLDQECGEDVSINMSVLKEYHAANLLFNTASYDGANVLTLSSTTKFSDTENSTPVKTIRAQQELLRKKIGVWPNTLTMGADVYNALRSHPDMIKASLHKGERTVSDEDIKKIFDVQYLHIGQAVLSADGETFTDIWSDKISIYWKPAQGAKSRRGPLFVTRFYKENKKTPYPIVLTVKRENTKAWQRYDKFNYVCMNSAHGALINDCL